MSIAIKLTRDLSGDGSPLESLELLLFRIGAQATVFFFGLLQYHHGIGCYFSPKVVDSCINTSGEFVFPHHTHVLSLVYSVPPDKQFHHVTIEHRIAPASAQLPQPQK